MGINAENDWEKGWAEGPSGLVVPQDRPSRQFKELELTDAHDRKIAQKAFQMLLELPELRTSGVFFSPPTTARARKELILFVAVQLMGDDFCYEELC